MSHCFRTGSLPHGFCVVSRDDVSPLVCVTGISFTPHEVGEHLVNVLRNRQHIPNSPFKIFVGESEIGNASKVKVYGKGLTEGTANETNAFNVNTKDAGAYDALSDCARVRAVSCMSFKR